LEEEDFLSFVKETWKNLNSSSPSSLMIQFEENISKVKMDINKWIKVYKSPTHRKVMETK